MGILFIPQVIYERGELWWSDLNRGRLLIRQSALWQLYHLVANQEDMGKGNG
jgi:hypothetical protein